MDDTPVATLRPNGSTISVYYVHTDHINSPLAITQPSTHALMWFWGVGGTGSPNQNPLNQGTFVYNLRYPGQYYLPETGLYYNYFRDYDPQTGRYVESDPIGLAGGQLTTYGYVDNNPISNIDPTGTGPAGAAIGGIVGGVIGGIVGSESGPGDAAAIAAGRAIGRAVGSAIENSCQTCPACTPYAKGTKGYIGPHTDHDHFPIGRPHLNLFEVNQNPSTCKCFWNKANPDVAAPPPQAGWVDLNSGFPPLSP
jgi:RHS repeat-associated protein